MSAAQPFAHAWLDKLAVVHDVSIDSSEFLWALQRRLGLDFSDAAPTLAALAAAGVHHDPLGDDITYGKKTDKSRPHNFALAAVHDAIQSCATHTVVMGDKETPEVYQHFNSTATRSDGTLGTVIDIAEVGMGRGRARYVTQLCDITTMTLEGPIYREKVELYHRSIVTYAELTVFFRSLAMQKLRIRSDALLPEKSCIEDDTG